MPRRAYNDTTLRAPFPWFGGKSRVAHLVWDRFGDVPNYVEPFFGSGAVMLMRPHPPRIETINDLDCYVANFWRSIQHAPEEVATYADSPVNEADLHARHVWLVNRHEFRERMKSDPDYFDAKIAGWWAWGISCWIGSGWCSRPEWTGRINASRAERGVHAFLEQRRPNLGSENGVHSRAGFEQTRPNLQPQGVHGNDVDRTRRKRPRITGFADAGVHAPPQRDVASGYASHSEADELLDQCFEIMRSEKRCSTSLFQRRLRIGYTRAALIVQTFEQHGIVAAGPEGAAPREILVDLDAPPRNPRNAGLQIWQKRPALHRSNRGTNRQLPDIGGSRSAAGRGVHGSGRCIALTDWFYQLADRLRAVRVCCGDWSRVLGRSPTECIGVSGIFLDPPYSAARDSGIYSTDDLQVAKQVREWAVAHGDNKKLRIALCGYEGEHDMPSNWTCIAWKANGGHGNAAQGRGRANATLERIWFSPHCLVPRYLSCFQISPGFGIRGSPRHNDGFVSGSLSSWTITG